MRALVFILVIAFALSGCNVAARLANGAIAEPNGEVVEPSGAIVEPDGQVIEPATGQTQSEIVALESDMCLVRARHFHGLVRVPCDQIAREPAP
jgi:hypothetical protein